nr:immunoglobulin heavy chain junction region [Macaca mulatta]MOX94766.1 immunoglobulin heavy chain junction region [Macaca mulatta]MOX95674.1 immunoglobulin heavy chain junction region [Macaca mulatta]MOX95844.1 immunoglobulin heavy chain junction region [Macaca mulatta]MOX96473.1 immunoglobulin heavy chain junction region [Macaca mulatta]
CARSPPDYGSTYGDAFDFW